MKIFTLPNLVFAVFVMTVFFCSKESFAMILEYEDVLQFKVQALPDKEQTTIKVSGLSGHSSLSVSKITTEVNGSVLVIYVHLTLATIAPGTSGRFEYEVPIPNSVDELKFGKNKVTIWKRNAKK